MDIEWRYGGLNRLNKEDAFEAALHRQLGDRTAQSASFAIRVWSALTNTVWTHHDEGSVAYSFRAAGGLIAAIRGEGGYMDWYCSGPAGEVDPEISEALALEGWAQDIHAKVGM